MPYNFVADSFHTKKLCSRLSSSEVWFYIEIGRFLFFELLWGFRGNVRWSSAFILSYLVTINLMSSFWEKEGIHLPSHIVLIICIKTSFSLVVFLSSYNFCCVLHYLPWCTAPVLMHCSRLMSNNKRCTYLLISYYVVCAASIWRTLSTFVSEMSIPMSSKWTYHSIYLDKYTYSVNCVIHELEKS